MPPDLMFWGGVAIKMAITALFVSAATITAEKLGAAVGALVATLPVSAGPVYVFLALDHDAAFISASALASLALNAATAIYVTVYVLLAQRHGVLVSVTLALAAWFAAALLFGPVHWAAWAALVLNLVIFVLCFFIVERYGHVRMPPTKRTWYGFMIRAGMVALLVGAALSSSRSSYRSHGTPCCTYYSANNSILKFPVECPLLALSGHRRVHCICPLLGAKRTCHFALHMSAFLTQSGHGFRIAKCPLMTQSGQTPPVLA